MLPMPSAMRLWNVMVLGSVGALAGLACGAGGSPSDAGSHQGDGPVSVADRSPLPERDAAPPDLAREGTGASDVGAVDGANMPDAPSIMDTPAATDTPRVADTSSMPDAPPPAVDATPAMNMPSLLGIPCARRGPITFAAPFTDEASILNLIPPGVAAGHEVKGHSYVAFEGERTALYAPADMELVQGVYYKEPPSFAAKTTYLLHFQVDCDTVINFDHITDPVDKIRQALNSVAQETTATHGFLPTPIAFKAGELVGHTRGSGTPEQVKRFDFGLYDRLVTNQFANQARYLRSYDWKTIHGVCPYERFAPALRDSYYAKFVNLRDSPAPGATCRSPAQDVPGTLAGSWFPTLDGSSLQPHVGIALDLGGRLINVAGLPSGFFSITAENPTFKDPRLITGEHCYYEPVDANRFVFVRVAGHEVDIAAGMSPSGCPATFPAGLATRYYR